MQIRVSNVYKQRIMKNLLINIPIILIAVLAMSCDEKECCADQKKEGANSIEGKWLLFEQGYSPGFGYIVEPVGAFPPQQIEFKDNGGLSCTVNGLADYKFYAINGDVVGLFKSDPGPAPDSTAFIHSYNFSFEEGRLRLGYRYCFEGCHLGFKKVE